MAAITWQNINSGSNVDPSRALSLAQNSFTSSFGGLSDLLAQRAKQAQTTIDKGRELEKQGYLGTLDNITTPEDFAKQQESIKQARAMLDPTVAASVRGADMSRLAALRQQADAAYTYNNTATDRNQAPLIDQFKQSILKGDTAGANAILDNNVFRNEADLVKFGQDTANNQSKLQREMAANVRADELAVAQQPNRLAQIPLETRKIAEENRNITNTDQDRQVASYLANVNNRYQASTLKSRQDISSVAKGLFPDLTVDPNGVFDPTQLDSKQEAKLSAELAKLNESGANLSSLSSAFDSDNQMQTAVRDKLIKQFGADAVSRNEDKINKSFLTNTQGTPVGMGKTIRDTLAAQAEVKRQERKATAWSRGTDPQQQEEYKQTIKDIPNLIDKTVGFSRDEDVKPIETLVQDIRINGIDLGNGRKYYPSNNDLRTAISTADPTKGTFGYLGLNSDTARADVVLENLKKLGNSPVMLENISKAEADNAENLKARVKAIRDGLKK